MNRWAFFSFIALGFAKVFFDITGFGNLFFLVPPCFILAVERSACRPWPPYPPTSYVNTLMIQRVLVDPAWYEQMTVRDLAALSPLMTQHINPYGRFELNMETRLPIETFVEA